MGGEFVKEYALKVTKGEVEGLEYTGEDSKRLIISTGSSGQLKVLELNAEETAWTL